MLDRAGAVPSDGVTHQGIFDISLLRPIPKLNILSVASADDLKLCLEWASESKDATVIRYPKLSCPTELPQFKTSVEIGRGIFIPCSEIIIENISEVELENRKNKILVVSTGGMFSEVHTAVRATLMDNGYSDIYLLRFIKPIDLDYFWQIAQKYHGVVFVEDGVQIGGISEYLNSFLLENNFTNTKILAFEDKFYEHGSRFDVCKCANLTSQDIASAIKELSAK
jgi:1-deoxy-D-xylulose-5-phosphate synthase